MSNYAEMPHTIDVDPDQEPTTRERLAALVERRLDIPMAMLAVVWAAVVAYELVAPPSQRHELTLVGNLIWAVFVVEFVAKLWVSGKPLRFLRRRWPSVLFLLLPALRILRVVRALRVMRVLPAAPGSGIVVPGDRHGPHAPGRAARMPATDQRDAGRRRHRLSCAPGARLNRGPLGLAAARVRRRRRRVPTRAPVRRRS